MMDNLRKPEFLEEVKVSSFCFSIKKYNYQLGRPERVIERYKNKNPDNVYRVIGQTVLNTGYSEYLGYEGGYGFRMTGCQTVYIVANTLGRRYKVLPEDIVYLNNGKGE
jgi:hypothetical protein